MLGAPRPPRRKLAGVSFARRACIVGCQVSGVRFKPRPLTPESRHLLLVAVAVEGTGDAFDHARGKGVGAAQFADPFLVFAAREVARAGGSVFYFAAGREAKSLLRAFVSLLLGHDLILKLGESSILELITREDALAGEANNGTLEPEKESEE